MDCGVDEAAPDCCATGIDLAPAAPLRRQRIAGNVGDQTQPGGEPECAALAGGAVALTLPPISSTRRLQILSPSPVPPYLRVVEASACWNAENRLLICAGVEPMPVSRTVTFSQTHGSPDGMRSICT